MHSPQSKGFVLLSMNPKQLGKCLAQNESMNECTFPSISGVGSATAVLYAQNVIKIAVNHIQH